MPLHRLRFLTCLPLAALLACGSTNGEPRSAETADRGPSTSDGLPARVAGDPSWRHDAVWDDGNAEFCAYHAVWARYGNHYPGRVLLITVKEPWAPELDVKADTPRPDGFPVLKLNYVRDVATGIYTYHQMASVFLRRGSGQLQKVAATSSEACGISTALARDGRLATHSYFDGQGDREQSWPRGALPEDGLSLLLRDYVTAEPPSSLTLLPSLLMGRFATLEPASWTVERGAPELIAAAGQQHQAVPFRLQHDGDHQTWWLAADPPHAPLRYERSDGTLYELTKCDRIPYWQMHDPGGESWLPEEVR
ncbi:MAG: hypothetical protein ACRD2Z_00455 [Thermoanaerobaculia bacterium]